MNRTVREARQRLADEEATRLAQETAFNQTPEGAELYAAAQFYRRAGRKARPEVQAAMSRKRKENRQAYAEAFARFLSTPPTPEITDSPPPDGATAPDQAVGPPVPDREPEEVSLDPAWTPQSRSDADHRPWMEEAQ